MASSVAFFQEPEIIVKLKHDTRAAWHGLELPVSGGKNYERLRSQVIASNESVARAAHSSPVV